MNEWVGRIIITPFYGYMVTFCNICISGFINNSENQFVKQRGVSQCPIGTAC
jgi:hypothetical protein